MSLIDTILSFLGLTEKKPVAEQPGIMPLLRILFNRNLELVSGKQLRCTAQKKSLIKLSNELKGKGVGVVTLTGPEHLYLMLILLPEPFFNFLRKSWNAFHKETDPQESSRHMLEYFIGNAACLFQPTPDIPPIQTVFTQYHTENSRELEWLLVSGVCYQITPSEAVPPFYVLIEDEMHDRIKSLYQDASVYGGIHTRLRELYDPEKSNYGGIDVEIKVKNSPDYPVVELLLPKNLAADGKKFLTKAEKIRMSTCAEQDTCDLRHRIFIEAALSGTDFTHYLSFNFTGMAADAEKQPDYTVIASYAKAYISHLQASFKKLCGIEYKALRAGKAQKIPMQDMENKTWIIICGSCRMSAFDCSVSAAIPEHLLVLLHDRLCRPEDIGFLSFNNRNLLLSLLSANRLLFRKHGVPSFDVKAVSVKDFSESSWVFQSMPNQPVILPEISQSIEFQPQWMLFFDFAEQLDRKDLTRVIYAWIALGKNIKELLSAFMLALKSSQENGGYELYFPAGHSPADFYRLLPPKLQEHFRDDENRFTFMHESQYWSNSADGLIDFNTSVMQKVLEQWKADRLILSHRGEFLLMNNFLLPYQEAGRLMAAQLDDKHNASVSAWRTERPKLYTEFLKKLCNIASSTRGLSILYGNQFLIRVIMAKKSMVPGAEKIADGLEQITKALKDNKLFYCTLADAKKSFMTGFYNTIIWSLPGDKYFEAPPQ